MAEDWWNIPMAGVDMYGGGGMYSGVQQYGGGGYVGAPVAPQQQYILPTPYDPQYPAMGWGNFGTERGAIPTTPVALSYVQAQDQFGQNYGPAPSSPYGDLSGVQFQDPTGGASNGSLYPGGDYNDQFNVPYNNPYGDLSGVPMSSLSPYGDLSGVRGGFNPYGDLSGAPTSLYSDFQGNYQPDAAPLPPPRPTSLDTGGATLQPGYQPIDMGYRGGERGYQMPTTSSTFGASPADVAPSSLYDQSYMDTSQGSYGSLMGGNDYGSPSTYEGMNGQQYAPPSQPINTSYQNPSHPMLGARGYDSFASPSNQSQQAYFNAGLTRDAAPSPYQTAFGGLDLNFMPQPDPNGTNKLVDRVPQRGGFVSYAAPDQSLFDPGNKEAFGRFGLAPN